MVCSNIWLGCPRCTHVCMYACTYTICSRKRHLIASQKETIRSNLVSWSANSIRVPADRSAKFFFTQNFKSITRCCFCFYDSFFCSTVSWGLSLFITFFLLHLQNILHCFCNGCCLQSSAMCVCVCVWIWGLYVCVCVWEHCSFGCGMRFRN